MRFTIRTEAWDTRNRSKSKRLRTWTVDAGHADDAVELAVEQAIRVIGWYTSISSTIVDVAGRGGPVDCAHDYERRMGGFVVRADGGRECRSCAAEHGTVQPPRGPAALV